MSISGNVRTTNFETELEVGLFSGEIISINPSIEEFKEILGRELKEDSKATDYLGKSKEDNTNLRIDFWIKVAKKENNFKKVSYFLEDKVRENKDGSKKQYINSIGACSWADDPDNLPDWFKKREYREAKVGEEDLYNAVRTWLGKLDYKDAETVLELDWKKLMKGNVSQLKEQIGGEFATNVVAMAEVKTVEKDGEIKSYQSVYNKALMPDYCLKQFRVVDYSKPEIQAALRAKKPKDLKAHEKFVVGITDSQYGSENFYSFKDLHTYDPSENVVASNVPIQEDDASY